MLKPAQLALETGEIFLGEAPEGQSPAVGEVVFNTGMTGYIESLTDPSYAGQILVFTYPLIGNYGVTPLPSWESNKIHVSGIVVSEIAPHYSHYLAKESLSAWLQHHHIPFITGVDTRALTKRLRIQGVIPGAITSAGSTLPHFEDFSQMHWVKKVSIKEPRLYGEGKKVVIAIDCGMKENILRCLTQYPITVKRVPYNYDFTNEHFDAIFISNGPGDPIHCNETIHILKKALTHQKPIFGICLGTQLLALAAGAKTYKLLFGHRAQNQPCLELKTGHCFLTSQNHSYAVDESTLPKDWQVTFRNLNDQSVEGIAHKEYPFFAVQFHPEASPGPMDTQWLFQKFYDLIQR